MINKTVSGVDADGGPDYRTAHLSDFMDAVRQASRSSHRQHAGGFGHHKAGLTGPGEPDVPLGATFSGLSSRCAKQLYSRVQPFCASCATQLPTILQAIWLCHAMSFG